MKNILFIHSSADMYGSDLALLNIIKYINKDKHKVFVILPNDGPLVSELNKLTYVHVEIHQIAILRRKNLSFKGFIQYVKDYKKSSKFLKKFMFNHKIDIVYTNTSVVMCGAIMAKKMKIKNIWHIREIPSKRLERFLISIVVNRYANLIVINSKATGNNLFFSKNKIRLVYDSVEDRKYFTSKISHEGFAIGMAGRINRWKGQKYFIDIAEIIHKKYPDVTFKIAGDSCPGEEYLTRDLEKYILDKGLQNCTEMLGFVKNMDDFYNSLDVFVLPSIQPEPFGLVVIEAMEARLPVVANKHGGPVEIIENGVSGYLVDYPNTLEMANTIIKLIENEKLRKEIGINARNRKRKLFSIKVMIKNIEKVLAEL